MINLTQNTVNSEVFIYVNTLSPDIPFTTPSFLFGFKNSYNNSWTYVVPQIVTQNSRFTQFQITLVTTDFDDPINGDVAMGPVGNWTYKLWATEDPVLDPSNGVLLDEGQMQLFGDHDETVFVSYVSGNDQTEAVVYLTRDGSKCLVWSTCPDLFSLTVVKWNECN